MLAQFILREYLFFLLRILSEVIIPVSRENYKGKAPWDKNFFIFPAAQIFLSEIFYFFREREFCAARN